MSSSSTLPSEALIELLAPDGYYKYLEVPKPSPSSSAPSVLDTLQINDPKETQPLASSSAIDAELVKKQYRKLSRKHHPDRPGGDAATFRHLNRAQKVLLDPKLRHQYDVLGIDLDEDETEDANEHHPTDSSGSDSASTNSNSSSDHPRHSSTAQGIIQEIASTILTSIFQLIVRTVMLGTVTVLLGRYSVTLYPSLAFLAFVAYRIVQRARNEPPLFSTLDVLSPVLLSAGLWAIHTGRVVVNSNNNNNSPATTTTWWFCLGEALVIGVFTYNSASMLPKTPFVMLAIAVFAGFAALWLRGSFWNYVTVVVLQLVLALLMGVAFPIVEMLLEAILDEKLKKVGDRVRAHHQVLEAYYQHKLKQQQQPQQQQQQPQQQQKQQRKTPSSTPARR